MGQCGGKNAANGKKSENKTNRRGSSPRHKANGKKEKEKEKEEERGEVGGLSYAKRQELATTTHFTVSEIGVLCKHFAELSASQQDDGVIDRGEWLGAFQQPDTLETSANHETQPMKRKGSSSMCRANTSRHNSSSSPTRTKPTVSAAVVGDSFVNLPTMFLDRMFTLFDGDGNKEIDLEEFIRGLSVFSKRGTAREKVAFAFRLYDIDGDGTISQSELRSILVGSLREANQKNAGSNVGMSPELLDQMISETFAEADTNGDGAIDREEFAAMVTRHPDIIASINFRASILAKGADSMS